MEDWRLVISRSESGAMNMAIDEAILLAVARGTALPTVRFYQWAEPAITLGYFQSYKKEIDFTRTTEQGVDIIRRLSGGRAVLHHQELTYSVAAPENNRVVGGTVVQTYLAISRGIVRGLREMSIPAEITAGKKTKGAITAACFDSPSRHEITVLGKKLVGSAQIRKYNSILQHGSVVIENEPDLLFSCLNYDNEAARTEGRNYFVQRSASLADILGYTPEFQEVAETLKGSLTEELGINLIPHGITDVEMTEALELYRSKYSTDAWNKKR